MITLLLSIYNEYLLYNKIMLYKLLLPCLCILLEQHSFAIGHIIKFVEKNYEYDFVSSISKVTTAMVF